jgi:hypothetical protein
MKNVLKIFFVIFIGMMIYGFYLKSDGSVKGDVIIGVGVLFLAIILMPLFIFYRFNKGKYKKYVIDPKSKNPFKLDQKPPDKAPLKKNK